MTVICKVMEVTARRAVGNGAWCSGKNSQVKDAAAVMTNTAWTASAKV